MPADLFRIVYYSRKAPLLEEGDAVGVEQILTVSRRNNARVGVTGALMFNSGCFAQVLEGGQTLVETTFNRIAFDPRHSGIVVLQAEAAAELNFPHFSMDFVGEYAAEQAVWASRPIVPGRPLVKPTPLFPKLDELLGETGPAWAPIEGS